MKTFISAILSILCCVSYAQTNLVSNPGFEKKAPGGFDKQEISTPGYLAKDWYVPLKKRSPHYFVVPNRAVAKANSGMAALGMVLGGKKQKKKKLEYITGTLNQPLEKGKAYCVCYQMILHRTSKWTASNFGVLFHSDQKLLSNVTDPTRLQADLYANEGEDITNTNWRQFCGTFTASGEEKYLSFGVFGNHEATPLSEHEKMAYFQIDGLQGKAYYQLDDISVVEVNDSMDCGCAPPPIALDPDSVQKFTPYLFALDASGSMKKGELFTKLRTSLTALLRELPYGTPVSFSRFSNYSKLLYSGTVEAGTPEKVDKILEKVYLGGKTNVYSGLETAYGSIKSTRPDSARMILISDGAFSVSNKIETIVKDNYEKLSRRLTIIQIEQKPTDLEKLEPYETSYIHTTPSELAHAISQIYKPKGAPLVACECGEEFPDTMNYHFVIDYSGSMKNEKGRAVTAVTDLYEQAPPTAFVSITAFSTGSTELFVGQKSDMSIDNLRRILNSVNVAGGTNPDPGVAHGLKMAERLAGGRFSHLIVVTDLKVSQMNGNGSMMNRIFQTYARINMAASLITVGANGLAINLGQYDPTPNQFQQVSKETFEKDLFVLKRSSCDYTTEPYHYNPVTRAIKKEAKRALRYAIQRYLGWNIQF